MAETTGAMTLDDVMKLEGRELNEAVAERLGWKRADYEGGWFMPDGSKTNKFHIPEFSEDWNDAMQVREWGRDNIEDWSYEESVFKVMGKRLGWQVRRVDLVAFLEPRDLARAALLVSP